MRALMLIMLFAALMQAQGEVRPATQADVRPPLQDAKAVALLDGADKLTYSPKSAGLKDLIYTQSFSQYAGLAVEVKWMLPDRRAAKVVVKPDAPEHTKRIAASLEKVLAPQVLQVLDNVIGKDNRSTYAGDEISLVSERLVRVVPRSERNAALFSENQITFDLRGLPVSTRSRKPSGAVMEAEVAWESFGTTAKLFRLQRVASTTATQSGRQKSEVRFTYVEQDSFHFPKTITVESEESSVIFSFSGYKVNSGLKASDFPDA